MPQDAWRYSRSVEIHKTKYASKRIKTINNWDGWSMWYSSFWYIIAKMVSTEEAKTLIFFTCLCLSYWTDGLWRTPQHRQPPRLKKIVQDISIQGQEDEQILSLRVILEPWCEGNSSFRNKEDSNSLDWDLELSFPQTHGAIQALWKYIKQNMYLKKLKQLIIGMDGVCATDHFDT